MRVHPSALKHGVTAQDAAQAAEWAIWIEPLTQDESPIRELRLGFDTQARLLETVVLILTPTMRWSSTRCRHGRSTSTCCHSPRPKPAWRMP